MTFICPKTNKPCEYTGCFNGSFCAIPKQKEESQSDLWEEIETLCRNFDNGDISDQQFKKEKTKYELKRK
jgi:hypothetical protein